MSSRSEVVSARFSPSEADTLAAAADAAGLGLSAYLRETVLLAELRSRPGTRVFRASSGAVITLWVAS